MQLTEEVADLTKVGQLAGGILGHPQSSALDCSAEADASAGLGWAVIEHMFPRLRIRGVAGSAQARRRTTQRGTN
jgi:hypothetical protein